VARVRFQLFCTNSVRSIRLSRISQTVPQRHRSPRHPVATKAIAIACGRTRNGDALPSITSDARLRMDSGPGMNDQLLQEPSTRLAAITARTYSAAGAAAIVVLAHPSRGERDQRQPEEECRLPRGCLRHFRVACSM
jgi:hypothetical protein